MQKLIATSYMFGGKNYDNKEGQSIIWERGVVFCQACNNRRIDRYGITQHIHTKSHTENLELFQIRGPQVTSILQQINKVMAQKNQQGQTLLDETKVFRCEVLEMLCELNCPVKSLGFGHAAKRLQRWAKKDLGSYKNLADYCGPLLEKKHDAMKKLLTQSYKEFAFEGDGTPCFAEAVCMRLRVVTFDWQIVDFVAALRLLQKSPDSDGLADLFVRTFEGLGVSIDDAVAAMLDRASVNQKAIKKICKQTSKPLLIASCSSHTLCKPTEKFKTPILDEGMKFYREMIMHPGGARNRMKDVLKSAVKTGSGVRYYAKWEQMCQTAKIGLDKLLEVAEFCKKSGYSEKSSKKFCNWAANPITKANAIMQLATVCAAGRIFCQSTYEAERSDPISITIYIQFKKIELVMEKELHTLPGVAEAAKKAAALLLPEKTIREQAIANAQATVDAKRSELNELQNQLKEMQPRRGRVRRNYKADLTGKCDAAVEAAQLLLQEKTTEVKKKKEELSRQECSLAEATEAMQQWKDAVVFVTEKDFLGSAKEMVKPGYDYYKEIYCTPGGELYNLRQAYEAASVFDVIAIKELEPEARSMRLHVLVDLFPNFGFEHFTPNFFHAMKEQIPDVLKHIDKPFDWSEVQGAKQYDKRNKKARNKKATAIHSDAREVLPDKWEDDIGERARRLWEWWKMRRDILKTWALALRLVILVMPSSCGVERVFSQLKHILAVCGNSPTEEMLELRTLVRCNASIPGL
jgi:hypothetical protein